MEQSFLAQWAALPPGAPTSQCRPAASPNDWELDAWDRELESAGLTVSEAPSRYLARVRPFLEAVAQSLLASDVTVEFAPGWVGGTDLSTGRAAGSRSSAPVG